MRFIIRPLIFLWLAFFLHAAHAQKWYEGGTLHDASALEWQEATDKNKLATMADFVVMTYKKEAFISSIQESIDTYGLVAVKQVAQDLVRGMDIALDPASDPVENYRLYVNQKVTHMAIMLMILSDMLKK